MITDQLKYSQDQRSFESYKKHVSDGIKNQEILLQNIPYEFRLLDPEEGFQTEKMWEYKPDCSIYSPTYERWIFVEVKINRFGFSGKYPIHLKKNQTLKLAEINGWFLLGDKR